MAHNEDRFLFFLKLRPELPHIFFPLVRMMAGCGIDVVPVSFADLKNLSTFDHTTLILSICQDLSSYRSFLMGRKHYLDQALMSGKHKLIDVSSFSPVTQMVELMRKNRYFFHKLPLSLEDLVRETAEIYYNEYKEGVVWPGGKRTTLPPL